VDRSLLGPVFAQRGPYEMPVNFRVTTLGADVDFPGDGEHRAWSASFRWKWVTEVVIDATPGGTILVIEGNGFRLPEIRVERLRQVIDPLRVKVGRGHGLDDQPPPPLRSDLTFEMKDEGCDIYHRPWIGVDHEDLIDASAEWLRDQEGIIEVVHDDIEILMLHGYVDADLRRALSDWWAWHLDGFDAGRSGA
jgi:hypothetical protein